MNIAFEFRAFNPALIFCGIFLLNVTPAYAGVRDTSKEEMICKNIGFKPKTTEFADCVVELVSRADKKIPSSSVSVPKSNGSAVAQAFSPNENLCLSYGFKVKTDAFSECLMRLDEAQRQEQIRHEQYQMQLKQYQKQIADYEARKKELERERNGRLLMALGLSIMNPQQQPLRPASSQQMPLAPTPPIIQNYTVRKADGSTVYCTYNAATGYMSCR